MGMTTDGLSYWQAETEGIELLNLTIGELLDSRAAELSDHEALVYSGYPEYGNALNVQWTYREYRERVDAVAKGLMALGLKKGDHVGLWGANVPEWPLVMLAAVKVGLVLTTINPMLRASEVEYILSQGDVQALFFMPRVRTYDHLATVRSLTTPGPQNGEVMDERLPLLRFVCLIGTLSAEIQEEDGWRPALLQEVIAAGEQIRDSQLRERQAATAPSDPAVLMYTSGTTGFPKGAVLTHYGLVNNTLLLAQRGDAFWLDKGVEGKDVRSSAWFPFFHAAGLVAVLLVGLYNGRTIYPLLGFDPLKALQIASQEKCHLIGGVSSMILAVLHHPDFEHYDLSSVQVVGSGGALVPVPLMEEVQARLGADTIISFGQTEGTCAITHTLPHDSFELKASTVGKPLPYIDMKIIEPATGALLPVGVTGELCYRGPVSMSGYYKMPEKTAEVMEPDGWIHSGDLATMDAQGYIRIVGRLKDMVIRGGENLFPFEIEQFLMRHPSVANAQVVGVPDAFFGEELLAAIILRPGVEVSETELRAYCRSQISHQKIPRYFHFVESYPMTGSGKVQKFLLREQAITSLGLSPTKPPLA